MLVRFVLWGCGAVCRAVVAVTGTELSTFRQTRWECGRKRFIGKHESPQPQSSVYVVYPLLDNIHHVLAYLLRKAALYLRDRHANNMFRGRDCFPELAPILQRPFGTTQASTHQHQEGSTQKHKTHNTLTRSIKRASWFCPTPFMPTTNPQNYRAQHGSFQKLTNGRVVCGEVAEWAPDPSSDPKISPSKTAPCIQQKRTKSNVLPPTLGRTNSRFSLPLFLSERANRSTHNSPETKGIKQRCTVVRKKTDKKTVGRSRHADTVRPSFL